MTKELKLKVAEKLAAVGPAVEDAIVDHLYTTEFNRRTEAALKVIAKLDEHEKEGRKLSKPDVETFDQDGKVAQAFFSKERTEARKKLTEQTEKLTKALESALSGGDWSKLFEVSK